MLLWLVTALLAFSAEAQSIRFYGYGSSARDMDRVKIAIDNPADNNPGPPADIGDTDFTVEFWIRPAASGNGASAVTCGSNYNWISGNIVFDRDRYGQGRAFGISLGNGRLVFGVTNEQGSSRTICGTTDLRDSEWHHVAVTRQVSTGLMEIFVDGVREASATGPTGTLSYPDNGVPGGSCNGGPCTNSDPYIVIGAEKHDVGSSYPSYSGWFTELRLSTVRRYTTSPFNVPTARFDAAVANTAALYRFDEGVGNAVNDVTPGGLSPGFRNVGGGPPAGPEWSTESPFTASAGRIRFAEATYAVSESDGTVSVTVTRVGGSAGPATIQVAATSGSATGDSDYQFVPTTLTWVSGNSDPQTVRLTLVDDQLVEGNESLSLVLSNATGASLGTPSTASVAIADNDSTSTEPPPPAPTPPPAPPPPAPPPSSSNGGGGGGATDLSWILALLVVTMFRLRLRWT